MTQKFCRFLLKIMGWKNAGVKPDIKKYVIISAPHTSAWDVILLVIFSIAVGVKPFWLAKKSLFEGPFGFLMKKLRGVPVERLYQKESVRKIVDLFDQKKEMILAITPEGTRKKTTFWRTGFYYIALEAKVPIILGLIDYKEKKAGVGGILYPCGDIEKDMNRFKEFYSHVTGKHPHLASDVALPPENKDRNQNRYT